MAYKKCSCSTNRRTGLVLYLIRNVILVKVDQLLEEALIGQQMFRCAPVGLLSEQDADSSENLIDQVGRLGVDADLGDVRLVQGVQGIDGLLEGGDDR